MISYLDRVIIISPLYRLIVALVRDVNPLNFFFFFKFLIDDRVSTDLPVTCNQHPIIRGISNICSDRYILCHVSVLNIGKYVS